MLIFQTVSKFIAKKIVEMKGFGFGDNFLMSMSGSYIFLAVDSLWKRVAGDIEK